MCVCVCVCVCVTCVSCNYPQDDISDRRSPLSVAVTISPLERQPRKVNGSQDIIDLRDIPILNVLPQNNVKQAGEFSRRLIFAKFANFCHS